MKDVYVVGYWSNVRLITDDKGAAYRLVEKLQRDHPSLPWAARTVIEAVQHAYQSGLADALDDLPL